VWTYTKFSHETLHMAQPNRSLTQSARNHIILYGTADWILLY